MIPVTITPNSINLLLDGRMRTVQRGHINFEAVKQAIRDMTETYNATYRDACVERLRSLVDVPTFIAKVTEGRVKVGDGEVRFDGQPVRGVIAERLVALLREGLDVRPLARFLDRVSNNPIETARDEIYLWLESGNLPICDDGCFLAFKKVQNDYSSSHLNPDGSKFYNYIGTTVKHPLGREGCDPNRDRTCSNGLHFCSWQYLPQFGVGGESRVVILKVAPEDVVAIPSDYNNSKGRAWKYTIIGESPEDECAHLFDETPVVDNWGLYDGRDYGDENDTDCDDYDAEGDVCGYGCASCHSDDMVDDDEQDVDHTDDEQDIDLEDEDEDEDADLELSFRHGRKTYEASEIKQLVEDYGQRGVSRMTGIPRTTLQGWLAQIKDAE